MKDNFEYTEKIIDGNPDSEYLIVCSNINSHPDTWVWKFCVHEFNYTPIFSDEYGNCNVKGSDLEEAMNYANKWINGILERSINKNKSIPLFLIKMK